MEDSRNIIKAIDALTLKAGGEAVDSKNITEAIDNLKTVFDQEAIGIDKTLSQEGLAADAKAVGDNIAKLKDNNFYVFSTDTLLTQQIDALEINHYCGHCMSFGHSEELGLPFNSNCYIEVFKSNPNYIKAIIHPMSGDPSSNIYMLVKRGGDWQPYTYVPSVRIS